MLSTHRRSSKFTSVVITNGPSTHENRKTPESARSNRSDKDQSPHLKLFNKIHNINLVFGTFVGFALARSWKWNKVTTYSLCFLIVGLWIFFHTMKVAYYEASSLLETLSYLGIIIPVLMKLHLVVTKWREMISAHVFVAGVFKSNKSGPKADLLNVNIQEAYVSIKVFISLQTVALVAFGFFPIYMLVVKKELVPFVSLDYPLINENTITGYILSSLISVKLAVWIYAGCIAFDLFLARLIYNYTSLVRLIELDLRTYADICSKEEYSENYKRAFLRNIFVKFQDKDNYINYLNDIFSKVIFYQFFVLYVCLTLVLYAILHNAWVSGLGMMIFCMTEIYVLCGLGTAVKTENDHLCEAIYDLPWYDFSVSTQRSIHMLLLASQNSMELWVGTLIPLNVETAMEITKSIYSTATMIVNLE